MHQKGILIISVDSKLDDISLLLKNAENYVCKKLFVHFHSCPLDYNWKSNCLPKLSPLIIKIYEESVSILPKIDLRVQISNFRDAKALPMIDDIDIILSGMNKPSRELIDTYTKTYRCSDFIIIGENVQLEMQRLSEAKESQVDTVVLGGTFDRLHVGHKILLTESVLRSKKRVVVGVTDENMIRKGKVLPELILPVQRRMQDVLEFLQSIDNTIKYEVVPISDPFGPTADDPDMDMIVVSKETFRGGQKVNEIRAQNGLKQLIIHTIPLVDHSKDIINDTELNVNEDKISSSRTRYDLLGKFMKIEKKGESTVKDVYLIGLICDKTVRESFLEALIIKGAVILEDGIESLEHFTLERKEKLVFLPLGTSFESENIGKCQEIWSCLSSDMFLTEQLSKISNILFTSSIPLEPQVTKAWNDLINRI